MNTQIRAGDTVICINAEGVDGHLTKGWHYEVVKAGEASLWVKANDGQPRGFDKERFIAKQRSGLKLKDCFIGKIVLANWSEQEIVHITGLSRNPIGEVIVTVRRPDSQRDVPINPANLFELE